MRLIAQIGKAGVRIGSPRELDEAHAQFRRDHCVVLPQFVAPDLLAWIRAQVAAAPFETFVHQLAAGEARELVMTSAALDARLHFLVNDRCLFDAVRRVTGCGSIGCFLGRVYKMVPGMGHHDEWHHDVNGTRMLALSVNLTDGAYDGGLLQIRRWDERRLVHEVANTGSGDAILFDLSLQLRHRVTEVTGATAKVAFAGWFETQPVYEERLPRRAVEGRT